jgi:ribose 5-phosphate isomerase RpiB
MASIAVGADDAGAPLKERLAAYLQQRGYRVKDFGNGAGRDYPDVAAEAGTPVLLDHWLASEFEPGRSSPKVAKINALDARYRSDRD